MTGERTMNHHPSRTMMSLVVRGPVVASAWTTYRPTVLLLVEVEREWNRLGEVKWDRPLYYESGR